MKKLTLCMIFGGRSAEHRISLISAFNILRHLRRDRYDLQLVGITPSGRWLYFPDQPFDHSDNLAEIALAEDGIAVALDPWPRSRFLIPVDEKAGPLELKRPDVIFPVLHGPFGEDGTIQGLFEITGIPYVGPPPTGCALCMDKVLSKQLFKEHGLPIGPYTWFTDDQPQEWQSVRAQLGDDLFVKPANQGSSVGISHVRSESEWKSALQEAFRYDRKILVEKKIHGRELECGLLGNEHPQVSCAGEITVNEDFYSYDAKYFSETGATLSVPASISTQVDQEMKRLAVKAFQAFELSGLSRIDWFLEDGSNKLYINEINTIPGFTPTSMYPMLWQHEGLAFADLLDQLIQFGLNQPQ